jgi:hypothetical protein
VFDNGSATIFKISDFS